MTTSRMGIMGSLRVSNFSLAWVTRVPFVPLKLELIGLKPSLYN